MRSRFYVLFCLGLLLILAVSGCKSTTETPAPTEAVQATVAAPMVEAPAVTNTPRPTPTSYPTLPPMSSPTPTFTPSPTPTAEPPTETPEMPEATPTVTAGPTGTPRAGGGDVGLPPLPRPPAVIASGVLALRDDPDVAPPLSIHVSANQALEGYRYRVSGVLRNDASENYAALGVVATFYTPDGSRYGPIKANVACLLLTPGDECPFVIEATSKNLAAVMLHPEGAPTSRVAAPLTFAVTGRYQDAVGYVHITGRVRNPNAYAVKNITVNGALLNAQGEIVATGMTILVDSVPANGAATFDVAIKYEPYANYRLYVQGEQ
ncbi:MAG: FxLYD domain-containing protein [Anaerolineae bacterium]